MDADENYSWRQTLVSVLAMLVTLAAVMAASYPLFEPVFGKTYSHQLNASGWILWSGAWGVFLNLIVQSALEDYWDKKKKQHKLHNDNGLMIHQDSPTYKYGTRKSKEKMTDPNENKSKPKSKVTITTEMVYDTILNGRRVVVIDRRANNERTFWTLVSKGGERFPQPLKEGDDIFGRTIVLVGPANLIDPRLSFSCYGTYVPLETLFSYHSPSEARRIALETANNWVTVLNNNDKSKITMWDPIERKFSTYES